MGTKLSKANRQSLCLLAAMKSGLVTVVQESDSLSNEFEKLIYDCDADLTRAVKGWESGDKDEEKAIYLLQNWVDELKHSGLEYECNMTVMTAMSLQACDDLLSVVRDKVKVSVLTPAREKLELIGEYLHKGMSDKHLIPKFERADEILKSLYRVTGFEV